MNIKAPVSIILVTHNEEANIENCLNSLDFAREIIVVDGNSSDRTAEIAEKYGARVLIKENAPCEIQRLHGFEHVKQPWFFLIDADEYVSKELGTSIRRAVSEDAGFSAYSVLRRNYITGVKRPVHFNHPEYPMRLFRVRDVRKLPEKIHRTPEVSGNSGSLKGELIHYFFPSVEQYIEKLNFYTTVEAGYCLRNPAYRLGFFRLFLRPLGRFIQNYFFKKACLDGYWGLVFSFGSAYYEVLVNLKVILAKKRGQAPIF
ncbi:MAG: glycosyltransferase family 2 protein [Candidatus Omnitrophica bacterium]|nr:glycosyltransferase family 2 protein [Candidatus Omnitrophota bacterium]